MGWCTPGVHRGTSRCIKLHVNPNFEFSSVEPLLKVVRGYLPNCAVHMILPPQLRQDLVQLLKEPAPEAVTRHYSGTQKQCIRTMYSVQLVSSGLWPAWLSQGVVHHRSAVQCTHRIMQGLYDACASLPQIAGASNSPRTPDLSCFSTPAKW